MKYLLLLLNMLLLLGSCAQTKPTGTKESKPGTTAKSSGAKTSNADTAVYLVNYTRFADAIKAAQSTGKWLIIPANYNVTEKIEIHGNLKMGAIGKGQLNDMTKKSEGGFFILLHDGNHTFKNIKFVYPGASSPQGYNAVQTAPSDITFNNHFYNCTFSGKWHNNYQSSLGHGVSAFYNTRFFAESENIQYFSQSGTKTLILHNDTLETLYSHCVYAHPINNYDVYDVLVLGSGKLAWDSYGTSPTVTAGKNDFQRFKKCRVADTASARMWGSKPMWRLWSSSTPIYIDSCALAGYEVAGKVYATNSNFYNAGNGSALGGGAELINCTGDVSVRDGQSISITNCKINNFGAGPRSNVRAVNSSIYSIGVAAHTGTYTKCTIGDFDLYLDSTFPNKIVFTDCIIKLPSYKLFRVVKKYKNQQKGLTFIRTPLPAFQPD